MSALVIVVMNIKENIFSYGNLKGSSVILNSTGEKIGGVDLTSLVAFSTMLSWSYYGLQGWKYLFGKGKIADITYKIIFLLFVIIGSTASLGSVIDFSDAMIFAMVFPNLIGLFILAPKVKDEITKYLKAIGYTE